MVHGAGAGQALIVAGELDETWLGPGVQVRDCRKGSVISRSAVSASLSWRV